MYNCVHVNVDVWVWVCHNIHISNHWLDGCANTSIAAYNKRGRYKIKESAQIYIELNGIWPNTEHAHMLTLHAQVHV